MLPSFYSPTHNQLILPIFWCLPMFEDILFSFPSTTPIHPLFSSCIFGLVSSWWNYFARYSAGVGRDDVLDRSALCILANATTGSEEELSGNIAPWIPQQCNLTSSWNLLLIHRRGLRGRGMRGGGIDVARIRRILVFNATSRVGTSPNHRDSPFRRPTFFVDDAEGMKSYQCRGRN